MRRTAWLARVLAMAGLGSCTGHTAALPRATSAGATTPELTTYTPAPEELAREQAEPSVRTIGRCERRGGPARFTVAHLNDLQARYSDRIGGHSRYSYIAGYLRELKREVPDTLVLDAGDDYEKGSIADLRSMGEATRRMIQALPIDVRTIGNHDFAYGEAAVLRDVQESEHPVLAANVHAASGAEPFLPFVRVDVGCVRVGIVGVVASNYGSDDVPSRAPFDGAFAQDNRYVAVVADQVRAHRDEVDVMIALDHVGIGPDIAIANQVSGVDLVSGGHTEDLVPSPYVARRPDGSRAWIAQAGHWGRTLGRADLVFDPRTRELSVAHYAIVKVDASLPAAEDVDELARDVESAAAPDAHAPIAVVATPVAQGKPMADLVFRAVHDRWGADALLIGKDDFWDGLPQGPVTLQRLFDAVLVQREPAGTSGFTSLYVASLSGAELAALRGRLLVGPRYAFYGPELVDPSRTYRLVIEKRALQNPALAFSGGPQAVLSPASARYGGEIIDVLEAYARSRTARGLAMD